MWLGEHFLSSVQLLSCVWLFATPWTAARQASLSITSSRSLLKLMSTESVMPSNHLILCRPLLLLPSIFPSIRVFSNESVLRIRWPNYWSFSFSISPSDEYSGLIPLGGMSVFYIASIVYMCQSQPPNSSRLQSFPASGSFPMSQFFTSGGQSIRVSASASVLPVNIQDWFPLGWTGWISLQSKGLSRVFLSLDEYGGINICLEKYKMYPTDY